MFRGQKAIIKVCQRPCKLIKATLNDWGQNGIIVNNNNNHHAVTYRTTGIKGLYPIYNLYAIGI